MIPVAGVNGERGPLRWMAMRRTLFVFAREDIALVQVVGSTHVAEALRRADQLAVAEALRRALTSWLSPRTFVGR